MFEDDRSELARKIVSTLPRYGRWARGFRDFDTPFGKLGYRQLAILWAIRYRLIPEDEVSPTRLAQLHEVQPSVVTRSLAKLEAGGFVERSVRPADARSHHIRITERGRQASEFVERLYVDDLVDSMGFLKDEHIDELQTSVETLGRIVEDLERKRTNRSSRINRPVATSSEHCDTNDVPSDPTRRLENGGF